MTTLLLNNIYKFNVRIVDYDEIDVEGIFMVGKYKVITLCGSTRFKDEFLQVQKQLTLEGNIVISVGFFEHADNEFENIITPEIKIMFDDMHKRKIDMSDEIYVINKNGYIGESTKGEIEYAMETGKMVNYLEYPNA